MGRSPVFCGRSRDRGVQFSTILASFGTLLTVLDWSCRSGIDLDGWLTGLVWAGDLGRWSVARQGFFS